MAEHLPLNHAHPQPERGAGLRALAVLALGWVTMRALFIMGEDGSVHLRPIPIVDAGLTKASARALPPHMSPPMPTRSVGQGQWDAPLVRAPLFLTAQILTAQTTAAPPVHGQWPAMASMAPPYPTDISAIDRDYAQQWGELFLFDYAPFGTAHEPAGGAMDLAPPPFAALSTPQPSQNGPFGLYAYWFIRPYAAAGAPFTRYGGSQMFMRADWRLGRAGLPARSSVYARVSRDMTPNGQAEFALGAAVQPIAGVPVTVHGEHRVREQGGGASAAFVSGAVGVTLPHSLGLTAYAQGGAVRPDRGTSIGFFDAEAALTTPIERGDSWRLDAGAKALAGGQGKTARIDIGPVVSLSGTKGPAQLQGELGWRFRIAGDTAPASGPAITVSVGF